MGIGIFRLGYQTTSIMITITVIIVTIATKIREIFWQPISYKR